MPLINKKFILFGTYNTVLDEDKFILNKANPKFAKLAEDKSKILHTNTMVALIKTILSSDKLEWGVIKDNEEAKENKTETDTDTDETDEITKLFQTAYPIPIKKKPIYISEPSSVDLLINYLVKMTRGKIVAFEFNNKKKDETTNELEQATLYLAEFFNCRPQGGDIEWEFMFPNGMRLALKSNLDFDNIKWWTEGDFQFISILLALDAAYLVPAEAEKFKQFGITITAPPEFKSIQMKNIIYVGGKALKVQQLHFAGCTSIHADHAEVKYEQLDLTQIIRNTYLRKIYEALSETEKKQWIKEIYGSTILHDKLHAFEMQIAALKKIETLNKKKSMEISGKLEEDEDKVSKDSDKVIYLEAIRNNILDEILIGKEHNINALPHPIILDHLTKFTKDHIKKPHTAEYLVESADNLEEKLKNKPICLTKKQIIFGIFGAFLGLGLGALAGGLATFWSGGWGALPLALLTAVTTFSIGTMIGGGVGLTAALSFTTLFGLYNFNKAKKIEEYTQKRPENFSEELKKAINFVLPIK